LQFLTPSTPLPETDIELVPVHRQDIGSLLDHWAERRPDHPVLRVNPSLSGWAATVHSGDCGQLFRLIPDGRSG